MSSIIRFFLIFLGVSTIAIFAYVGFGDLPISQTEISENISPTSN